MSDNESLLDESDDSQGVGGGGDESLDANTLLDTEGEGSMLDAEVLERAKNLKISKEETEGDGDTTVSDMNGSPPEVPSVEIMDNGLVDQGPEINLGAMDLQPRLMLPTVDLPKLSVFTTGPLADTVKAMKLLNSSSASGVVLTPSLKGPVAVGPNRGGGGEETDEGSRGGPKVLVNPLSSMFGSNDVRLKASYPSSRFKGGGGGQVSGALHGASNASQSCDTIRPLKVTADQSSDNPTVNLSDAGDDEDEEECDVVDDDGEEEEEEEDEDDYVTPQNSPSRGNTSKGSAKPKTAAQVIAAQAKKARKNARQKERKKVAAQAAAILSNKLSKLAKVVPSITLQESTPQEGKLKRCAGPPVSSSAKKSKLDASPMAQELARYLAQENPFAGIHWGAQHNPIFRHGPIPLALLRSIAHSLSALKPGAMDDPCLGHPSGVWHDEHGLLLLSLDPTNLSMVGPSTATVGERSGVQFAELTFFSSKVLSYGQRIAAGTSYQCTLCQSSHFPVPRSHTVLVTGSELIGAPGLPFNMGLPCPASVDIPRVSPQQCWDSLVLHGGLRSDPFKVLQSIYGSVQGGLLILLDLGTQPIVHGESAASVITRLEELVMRLVQSLRRPTLGITRVLVLPPTIHLGHESLALNQVHSGPHNTLVMAQLNELKLHIDSRNFDRMGNRRPSPLHSWSELFSALVSKLSRDPMGRSIGEVQVVVNPGVMVDGGCLYLRPDYLHSTVSNLVAFAGAHSWLSW